MKIRYSNHLKVYLIGMFCVVIGIIFMAVTHSSITKYKYQIRLMDGHVYSTNSFRMYGNNLIFDTEDEQVIINAQYVITSELEKVPD